MNDYPLRVKIVASLAIVLVYVIGLPLFGLIYAAGYWADRWSRCKKSFRWGNPADA
jgi:hypothetical protein